MAKYVSTYQPTFINYLLQLGICYASMYMGSRPFADGFLMRTLDTLFLHYAYQAQQWKVCLVNINILQEGNWILRIMPAPGVPIW